MKGKEINNVARLDDELERFYARLAARAEAEDYCQIELVLDVPSAERAAETGLDRLIEESDRARCTQWGRIQVP